MIQKMFLDIYMTFMQLTSGLEYHNINPELFRWGFVVIRWYSLAYIAGLMLAWWYLGKMTAHKKSPTTKLQVDDFILWATIGIIFGGRLGYVIFYNPAFYFQNPSDIFQVWDGGMSFHGGFIGVVLATILFCKTNKINLFAFADQIAIVSPMGLFFGRIANFINGELWGKITDVSWGVVFCNDVILEQFGRCPAGTEPRHPSQIYEALLEGALLFAILRIAMVRFALHRRPGLLTALFMAGYGVFRFAVEFFRDSESKIYEWFSVGQALSIPMVLAAALFAWYAYHASAKAPSKALGTKTVK